MVWRSIVCCGVVLWYGMVWYGMVWCGVVWCDVVWCGVVWCGMVCWGNCYLFIICYEKTKWEKLHHIHFLACDCSRQGSITVSSCKRSGGQCRCRPYIIGRKCDQCLRGYYGFPSCKCTWYNAGFLRSKKYASYNKSADLLQQTCYQ